MASDQNLAIVPADNLKKQGLYFDHPRLQPPSEPSQAADAAQGPASRPPSPPNIRPRTAQACDKCRERKTKCSGEKPTCTRCSNRGLICHYSTRANRSKGHPAPSARREQRRASRESDSVSHHKASPPGIPQYPARTSTANSPNVFKPYPCPSISRYSAGSNGAYTNTLSARPSRPEYENYRSPQPIVLGSGTPFVSNAPQNRYDCRQPKSFVEGNPGAYIDHARNSRDSLPGCNAQLWNAPYMAAPIGRPGDYRLASGLVDREPCLSRASNSSSSDESLVGTPGHSVVGPSDFYYRGGVSATGSPSESLSTAHSVSASYVGSHFQPGSFLDFANSFASSHPSPATEWSSPEVSPPAHLPPQNHLELAYPPMDNNRCYQYSYT